MSINLHWKADVSTELLNAIEICAQLMTESFLTFRQERAAADVQKWLEETRAAFLVSVTEHEKPQELDAIPF